MAEGTTRNGVHRPGGLAKARVVVLGGGFGGLETAFDLRLLARDRAGITFSDHAAERDPRPCRARDQQVDASAALSD
ncbi:MAG TPA: hypothetical protein VFY30_07605 [Solirubrobacterales bacterium]|nr:hypothetical protein [Solirubrobacterales bacterium]